MAAGVQGAARPPAEQVTSVSDEGGRLRGEAETWPDSARRWSSRAAVGCRAARGHRLPSRFLLWGRSFQTPKSPVLPPRFRPLRITRVILERAACATREPVILSFLLFWGLRAPNGPGLRRRAWLTEPPCRVQPTTSQIRAPYKGSLSAPQTLRLRVLTLQGWGMPGFKIAHRGAMRTPEPALG